MKINNIIQLKTLNFGHVDELFEAVSRSRDSLSQYLPWVEGVTNLETTKTYINERINSGKFGAQWFAVYVDGLFGGVFAIKQIDKTTGAAELGYWLADSARGKRVMQAVLGKMIPFIKNHTDAKIVEFQCLEKNHTSIKLVKHVGAQFIGYQKDTLQLSGKEQLLGLYRLHLYK